MAVISSALKCLPSVQDGSSAMPVLAGRYLIEPSPLQMRLLWLRPSLAAMTETVTTAAL